MHRVQKGRGGIICQCICGCTSGSAHISSSCYWLAGWSAVWRLQRMEIGKLPCALRTLTGPLLLLFAIARIWNLSLSIHTHAAAALYARANTSMHAHSDGFPDDWTGERDRKAKQGFPPHLHDREWFYMSVVWGEREKAFMSWVVYGEWKKLHGEGSISVLLQDQREDAHRHKWIEAN